MPTVSTPTRLIYTPVRADLTWNELHDELVDVAEQELSPERSTPSGA